MSFLPDCTGADGDREATSASIQRCAAAVMLIAKSRAGARKQRSSPRCWTPPGKPTSTPGVRLHAPTAPDK